MLIFCYSAIQIDTANLKDNGKATQSDRDALQYLKTQLQPVSLTSDESLDDKLAAKFAKLVELKFKIDHLSSMDLLRRDVKSYKSSNGWTYTMSTVPVHAPSLSIFHS